MGLGKQWWQAVLVVFLSTQCWVDAAGEAPTGSSGSSVGADGRRDVALGLGAAAAKPGSTFSGAAFTSEWVPNRVVSTSTVQPNGQPDRVVRGRDTTELLADASPSDAVRPAIRQGRSLGGQQQSSDAVLTKGRRVTNASGAASQGNSAAALATGMSRASSRHIDTTAHAHAPGAGLLTQARPAVDTVSNRARPLSSHRRLQQSVLSNLQSLRQSSSSATTPSSSSSATPSSAAANLGDGPSSLNSFGSGLLVGTGNKGVSLAQGAAQEFGTGWSALTTTGGGDDGGDSSAKAGQTRGARSQTVNTGGAGGSTSTAAGAPSLSSTGVSGGWSAGQRYAYSSPYLINPDVFAGTATPFVNNFLNQQGQQLMSQAVDVLSAAKQSSPNTRTSSSQASPASLPGQGGMTVEGAQRLAKAAQLYRQATLGLGASGVATPDQVQAAGGGDDEYYGPDGAPSATQYLYYYTSGTTSSHTPGSSDVYSHDAGSDPRPGGAVLVSTSTRPASGAGDSTSGGSGAVRSAGVPAGGAGSGQGSPSAAGQTQDLRQASGSSAGARGAASQGSIAALGGGPQSTSGHLADAYLEEYGYTINPIKYSDTVGGGGGGGSGLVGLDQQQVSLLQYINTKGPFGPLINQQSPDMPSLLGILKDEGLIGGGGKAGASTGGVSSSSSPAAGASGSAAVPGGTAVAGTNGVGSYLPGQRLSSLAGMLKSAQQVAYDMANAVTGSGGGQAPLLGAVPVGAALGDYAGKGFGYGDYDYSDYYTGDYGSSSSSTGVSPGAFRASGAAGGGSGPLGGGAGLSRNSSVGEVAPECQPPILRCADRDLINFFTTDIDTVRYPDNVLEYNLRRYRIDGAAPVFVISPVLTNIGGPSLTVNELLTFNWRLRTTIALLNGRNGLGANSLSLGTWQLDATRPDRIFPDSFSYNVLGLNEINSINRVRYVPTYVITGTGPGFATSDIFFGPFTEFGVRDFAATG